MRTIKFRAFHLESKKMYWFDIMNGNHNQGNGYIGMSLIGQEITNKYYRDNMILVDPDDCKIMQFIGKTDKNDKEICESDVLLYMGSKGVVFYEENTAMFMTKFEYSSWSFDSMDDEIEILGNIYENPELLKD